MVECVILSACDGSALAGKLNFMTNSPQADLQASLIESMGKQNKAAQCCTSRTWEVPGDRGAAFAGNRSAVQVWRGHCQVRSHSHGVSKLWAAVCRASCPRYLGREEQPGIGSFAQGALVVCLSYDPFAPASCLAPRKFEST